VDSDNDNDGYNSNEDCNDNHPLESPDQTWYQDADNDGYSNGTTNTTSCIRPAGFKAVSELTSASGDCNDSNASIHPKTIELFNAIDDNCNGQIDEMPAPDWDSDSTTSTSYNQYGMCISKSLVRI